MTRGSHDPVSWIKNRSVPLTNWLAVAQRLRPSGRVDCNATNDANGLQGVHQRKSALIVLALAQRLGILSRNHAHACAVPSHCSEQHEMGFRQVQLTELLQERAQSPTGCDPGKGLTDTGVIGGHLRRPEQTS